MAKLKRTCLVIVALMSLCAWADTWTDPVTGYTWTYRINGDGAEIYGSQEWDNTLYEYITIPAISPMPSGAVAIPSMLGNKPVVSIYDWAFGGCNGLTSITIPNSVTSMGIGVFYGCSGLTSITLPNGVTSIADSAFAWCTNLTSVTIPSSVTSIGDMAFYNCSCLASVTIPNNVTNIGHDAFAWCSNLMGSLAIPDGVMSIADYTFYGCSGLTSVTIPNSITNIGGAAFGECIGLTNITIPDSVTVIGQCAFSGCSGLSRITIPSSVMNIEDGAFQHCNMLTNVVISNSVTNIGEWAFYECDSLTSVTIPNSVTNIGQYAFGYCYNLSKVYVPQHFEGEIDGLVFQDCSPDLNIIYYNGDHPIITTFTYTITNGVATITGASNITSVLDIPATIDGYPVVAIGYKAFQSAISIVSLTIPDSVETIGKYAFQRCFNLECVKMGTGVKTIGKTAFDSCTNLVSVSLSHGISDIAIAAFESCSSLETIVLPSSVTNLSWSSFKNCLSLHTAYLHISLKDKKNKDWFEGCPSTRVIYYNCETPAAPMITSLSASNDGPGVIRVEWSVDVEAERTGFKVYKATSNEFSDAEPIAELSENATLYDDHNVSANTNYFYWVVAINDIFESPTPEPVIGSCRKSLSIVVDNIPSGIELVDYEYQFAVENETGNLSWRVEYEDDETVLPSGLELSAEGMLTGRPIQAGTYTFVVTCQNTSYYVSTSAEVTIVITENDNRKPSITEVSPSNGTDIVLEEGTSQLFTVSAADPDGKKVRYVWTVDGEEIQSGAQAKTLLFDPSDYDDTTWEHEVVCYVNDDLWTNIVCQRWMAYMPQTLYVDANNGSDDNDGLTSATAFESIYRAVDAASPYSTIYVASGTYSEGISIWCPMTIDTTDGPATIEYGIVYDGGEEYTEHPIIRGFIIKGAYAYVAAKHVDLERCVITGCGETNDYYGGEIEVSGILQDCTLNRCTIAGNAATSEHPLMIDCSYDESTIVWNNNDENDESVDPVFVSLSNGDCRLRAASPYVVNGIATRGALDEVVSGHVIVAMTVGPGKLDKTIAVVESGRNVTFTVVLGSHPMEKIEVDGNVVANDGRTYTFNNIQADATMTVYFTSNTTFHVDAINGSDSFDGFTKATAVATLQEAINRSVNGDSIIVADGVYTPIATRNRSIVIESENGYTTTIIDGGGTNNCALLEGPEPYDEMASIPYNELWRGTNTVLRGFTLRNGWGTWGAGVTAGTVEKCLIIDNAVEAYSDPWRYVCPEPNGLGGGAFLSVLRDCTIIGNSSIPTFSDDGYTKYGGFGGGSWGCQLYGCIEWDNYEDSEDSESDYWMIEESTYAEDCCREDPLFANASKKDYRPLPYSPAVVYGVVTAGCESNVYESITLYVDAVNGNDMADGFTKATAVATLQEAIDRSANGDTIHVTDGTYSPLHMANNNHILIESENGYKTTIIDGGRSNACVSFMHGGFVFPECNNPSTNAILRGFTLRNGRDILGAGAYGGKLEHCLIIDNVAYNEEPGWSATFDCGRGGGVYGSTLRYCTVVGNKVENWVGNEYSGEIVGYGGGAYGCMLENCIVWNNIAEMGADCFNCETIDCVIGENPCFANAADGDYHLKSNSPCIVNGVVIAGCETEVTSVGAPELTAAQVTEWISDDLAVRFAKSGESMTDYQNRFTAKFGNDPVAAMTKPTNKKDVHGNAMYVWQDYVAGTDPTDTNSVFTAKIDLVDDRPTITWEPKLSATQEAQRIYTIYGKTNLTDAVWHSPTNSSSRFFKVGVEMK